MTDQVENKEEQVAAEAPQAEVAELNLNDLRAMKDIIDLASARGAFKPAEMSVVGQTYNKLTTFLDAVAKQAEAAKAAQPGA